MIEIDSLEDPRLDAYRLVRDRDLIVAGEGAGSSHRAGRFMAEGELVVRRLVEGGRFGVQSVLLAENRVRAMEDVVARLSDATPVYVVPRAVMNAVVGFDIHRGVLAAGLRAGAATLDAALAGAPRVVLALEAIANHDNMGALFRNGSALGVGAVVMDGLSCDPLYRKAIRVSMGAALCVPYGVWDGDGAGMVGELRARGYTMLALTPGEDAADIDESGALVRGAERVALVLGAEGPGLSAGAMGAADARVRIAMAPGADSLNVATAAAVALHAARRMMR